MEPPGKRKRHIRAERQKKNEFGLHCRLETPIFPFAGNSASMLTH